MNGHGWTDRSTAPQAFGIDLLHPTQKPFLINRAHAGLKRRMCGHQADRVTTAGGYL